MLPSGVYHAVPRVEDHTWSTHEVTAYTDVLRHHLLHYIIPPAVLVVDGGVVKAQYYQCIPPHHVYCRMGVIIQGG